LSKTIIKNLIFVSRNEWFLPLVGYFMTIHSLCHYFFVKKFHHFFYQIPTSNGYSIKNKNLQTNIGLHFSKRK